MEDQIWVVYLRYVEDGPSGPEYFTKVYAASIDEAKQKAIAKHDVPIEIVEVVPDKDE